MSALPFTPLTITPRPTASRRPNSPSPREGAGGWVPIVTNNTATPNQPDALPPSQREGGRPFVHSDPDLPPPHPVTPSPSHAPAPLFSPDETTAAAIIDDFAGQDENLRGIADKYDTTLESLTLWLARPDIKERLFALESACAARARLVVANNLAAIAHNLLHLLIESKLDHESIHRVPAATHHAFAARMQSRESARKTANLLLRIARYVPSANPAPHTPPPKSNPTRQRVATAAHPAPQAPEDQQHRPAPPRPAPHDVAEPRLIPADASLHAAADAPASPHTDAAAPDDTRRSDLADAKPSGMRHPRTPDAAAVHRTAHRNTTPSWEAIPHAPRSRPP